MRKLIPLISVLAAACATHVAASKMNARVLGQQTATQAEPIAGAHLLLQCPDGTNLDFGTTAPDGTLRISPSTAPALDCKLTALQPGWASQSVRIEDICVERAANTCVGLSANYLLQRPTGSAGY